MKMKFLSASLAGLLSLGLHAGAGATTYIRYEAHSPGGQRALASMQKAFEILKKRGCTDPVSWYYQGAMHWTPDVTTGTNLVTNPLCPSYTKENPELHDGWNNCASHNPTGVNSDIHFLPWHRIYLGYFEKMIRELSGDPDFALPYWGYDLPGQNTLPSPFQASADNSLFEKARRTTLNEGKPIDGWAQQTINKDIASLKQVKDYETFNNQLNFGLHGFMHDYIGANTDAKGNTTQPLFNPVYNAVIDASIDKDCIGCGLMAEVPSAGFDAIFWLHHANVDRLWQNFVNTPGDTNISLDQLKSVDWHYHFFQPVRTREGAVVGKPVHLTMSQVYAAITNVDYKYDQELIGADRSGSLLQAAAPLKQSVLAKAKLNVQGNKEQPLTTQIKLPANKSSQLLAARSGQRSRTVLELDVSYKDSRLGRYEVFVNFPKDLAPDSPGAEKYFAGAISFFVNDPEVKGGSRVFRYDVSDELAASNNAKVLNISIYKTSGPDKGAIVLSKAAVLSMN